MAFQYVNPQAKPWEQRQRTQYENQGATHFGRIRASKWDKRCFICERECRKGMRHKPRSYAPVRYVCDFDNLEYWFNYKGEFVVRTYIPTRKIGRMKVKVWNGKELRPNQIRGLTLRLDNARTRVLP